MIMKVNTSTHATWQSSSPDKKRKSSASSCSSSSDMPGAIATIKRTFGYKRKWNFRSSTGFTALGVVKDADNADDINGILFQIPHEEIEGKLDMNELKYL